MEPLTHTVYPIVALAAELECQISDTFMHVVHISIQQLRVVGKEKYNEETGFVKTERNKNVFPVRSCSSCTRPR